MARWDLDTRLLQLSPKDFLTLRQALEGIHAFGATGSGKTTSLKILAHAYLGLNMGGLTVGAKATEPQRWIDYARATGRSNSVIMVDENHCFDFIDHELSRHKLAGIGSVVDHLMHIIEIVRRSTSSLAGAGDVFWGESSRQLIQNAALPLYAAYGTVSIKTILQFVSSAPTDPKAYVSEEADGEKSYETDSNFARRTMTKAFKAPVVPLDAATQDALARFWIMEYTAIPDRTLGNIKISLQTALGRFTQGRLQRVFVGKTTVCPELCFSGAVLVLNAPVQTWNEDGIIFNKVWKYCFERAAAARMGLPERFRERPLFLWVDESPFFCTPNEDGDFIATCREFRVSVVFIAQNLPTYQAKCPPGETHTAEAMVNRFTNFLFFQNACHKTNEFASQLIGRGLVRRANFSEGHGTTNNQGMSAGSNVNRSGSSSRSGSWSRGGGSTNWNAGTTHGSGENWGDNRGRGSSENTSHGFSETMDWLVEPSFFARGLSAGGPANDNKVTAAWFRAGANFKAAGGGNVLFPTFRQ